MKEKLAETFEGYYRDVLEGNALAPPKEMARLIFYCGIVSLIASFPDPPEGPHDSADSLVAFVNALAEAHLAARQVALKAGEVLQTGEPRVN